MEDLFVSNFVILTNSDKADVRICNDPTSRTLERKIPLEKVVDFVLKNLGGSEASPPSNYSRSDSKPSGKDAYQHHRCPVGYLYYFGYKSGNCYTEFAER